jgi:hypothetical protein
VNNFPLKSFQLNCEILAPTEKDFSSDLYKNAKKGQEENLRKIIINPQKSFSAISFD